MVMAKWFDLHEDLIERISNICTTADHIRMQCVCKSWRSVLKNTVRRELPWLMMLPSVEEEDPDVRVFFSLSEQKIHTVRLPEIRGKRCCGSFQNGWLMIVDEMLDFFLFHPWSRKKIDLLHHSTLKRLNAPYPKLPSERIRDREIVKAAVSDDGIVMIAYGIGYLAFCRIGDDAYTEIETEELIGDVIYHKGKFYALTETASVHLLHIKEDIFGRPHVHIEILTDDLDDDLDISFTYLVGDVLTDSIFVISRYGEDNDTDEEDSLPRKTISVEIFKVNLEESKTLKGFTKVESLGNRVPFLGYNSPIVFMASQFPGFKGNCIYFTDNMIDIYYNIPNRCGDSCVFNVKEGTVEDLFTHRSHPVMSRPVWVAIIPYSSREIF